MAREDENHPHLDSSSWVSMSGLSCGKRSIYQLSMSEYQRSQISDLPCYLDFSREQLIAFRGMLSLTDTQSSI
jgi:hypothetical protein